MKLALLIFGMTVAAAVVHREASAMSMPASGAGDDLPLPDLGTGALPSLDIGSLPDSVSFPDYPINELGFTMPPVSTWTPPATATPYLDTINAASAANGLPDGLLARLLFQESRFRTDIISGQTRSPVGALGIAQFMPATAADLGVDPLDTTSSINGAARYLKSLYAQTGDWSKALAAYNWGIGNVKRKGLANAPPETRAYVADITTDIGLS